ncbi:hypothetical protein GN244_ATG01209 [Phytophthora infestans]|uniref:Uncharacterized protein n=1 Tax=Phytophthora infestans TaxID=4787 RepID=A0A833TF32_PHYIN|nr:hypothetical protein GN244_ATG01209 [Phytophthora infestans]KAF4145398.1 hypothetical protein GN958_ATG05428 [Phytophthora infestans]
MASRSTPPLSTLLYVRDKAAEPKRTMKATVGGTMSSRDSFEAKLVRTIHEVFAAKEESQRLPTDLVTKESKNVFWRQFVISKAAMIAGHR